METLLTSPAPPQWLLFPLNLHSLLLTCSDEEGRRRRHGDGPVINLRDRSGGGRGPAGRPFNGMCGGGQRINGRERHSRNLWSAVLPSCCLRFRLVSVLQICHVSPSKHHPAPYPAVIPWTCSGSPTHSTLFKLNRKFVVAQ